GVSGVEYGTGAEVELDLVVGRLVAVVAAPQEVAARGNGRPAERQGRDGDHLVGVQPRPPRGAGAGSRPVEVEGAELGVEAAAEAGLDGPGGSSDGPIDLRVTARGLLDVQGRLHGLARDVRRLADAHSFALLSGLGIFQSQELGG